MIENEHENKIRQKQMTRSSSHVDSTCMAFFKIIIETKPESVVFLF